MGGGDQWPYAEGLSAYSGGTVMALHHLPLTLSSFSSWNPLLKLVSCAPCKSAPGEGDTSRRGHSISAELGAGAPPRWEA